MEILFLLLLICLNGFFAMTEISLVTARAGRLARMAEEGDASAGLALKLHEDPTRVLSAIQIGITAIGVLNGIVGESVLAVPLSRVLQSYGLDRRGSDFMATTFAVVTITYLSIVIGELVPKRIGQFHAERIARLVAKPIALLTRIAYPFVKALSISTEAILSLALKNAENTSQVTEEDIEAMLDEGSISGAIATQERDLVKNVFRLDDRQIASIMIPAVDIVFLDTTADAGLTREILLGSQFSRFPVCQGGLSHIVGVTTAKNLLNQMVETGSIDLTRDLETFEKIPESLSGIEILEKFRHSTITMAFVVDEYGEIVGMVTVQDLLEILTGEFVSQSPEDAVATLREDGSWLLDGLIAVEDMVDRLQLSSIPEADRPPFRTLSGMIMYLLGRVPTVGEICYWDSWQFEVVDLDGKRVDKVLATKSPAVEPPAES